MTVVNIARCPVHGLHGERERCFVCDQPVEQVPMVPLDYFTAAEFEWLESAARRAARDKIAELATAGDDLLELAGKLRQLRIGP